MRSLPLHPRTKATTRRRARRASCDDLHSCDPCVLRCCGLRDRRTSTAKAHEAAGAGIDRCWIRRSAPRSASCASNRMVGGSYVLLVVAVGPARDHVRQELTQTLVLSSTINRNVDLSVHA